MCFVRVVCGVVCWCLALQCLMYVVAVLCVCLVGNHIVVLCFNVVLFVSLCSCVVGVCMCVVCVCVFLVRVLSDRLMCCDD